MASELRDGLQEGTHIREWEVLRRTTVGRGAGIYIGRHVETGEEVVIKTFDPRTSGTREQMLRFLRESEIYRHLDHPGVVRSLAFGVLQGVNYVVLEKVEGRTVELALQSGRGPMPVSRALAVTRTLLDALAHAHDLGIIHRDINPRNVMITPEGAVKLLDFGVASARDGLVRTGLGEVLGTFRHASPEQNRGMTVDARSDLYSLGLLLWEMLVGTPAIPANDLVEAVTRQLAEDIPPPSSLNPTVPPGVDALCLLLLRADPEQRPPDARAARALMEELAGPERRAADVG